MTGDAPTRVNPRWSRPRGREGSVPSVGVMSDTPIAREDAPSILYAVFTDGNYPEITTEDEDAAYELADDIDGRVVTYEKA